MNSNRSDQSSDTDDFTELLRALRPAKSDLDATVVFYRAGLGAGRAQAAARRTVPVKALAAGLVAAVIAAPLGYMAGQASPRSPQVAAEPQRNEGVQVGTRASSRPSPAPTVEPPPEQLVAVSSRESSLFSIYAPLLVSLWEQPPQANVGASPGPSVASLAAFHSFVSSSSGNREQWPEYFVQCDALLRSDPSTTDASTNAVRSDFGRSSTMAVGDARQMATMMEAIR